MLRKKLRVFLCFTSHLSSNFLHYIFILFLKNNAFKFMIQIFHSP